MKHTPFLRNAAILTVTSLVLRTVGIYFRIFLSGKIGPEGMGLYQLVVSIYVLGATFAAAGISTAVTRMTAQAMASGANRQVRRILRRSIQLSLLIGAASSLAIWMGADAIAGLWLRDMRAAPAIRILTLAFPFMGASACFKGYFIARRRVSCTSRSQLLEQTVRITVIFFVIDRYASLGLAQACMAVMAADALSEAVSCVYLWLSYLLDRRRIRASRTETPAAVTKPLLTIALPITAGRYLNTALRTVENTLVPDCLARYSRSKSDGLAQFGTLKGMALPLLFFPASFLTALSTLLVPEISQACALGDRRKVQSAVRRTLRFTLTASILIGALFTLYAAPLGDLFYGSQQVGFLLRVLAPLMPVMYLESVIDGILKGLGQQVSSFKYGVVDSAVRIIMIVCLVPRLGMQGFLFVMVVSNMLTSFLNLHRLLTVTQVRMQWFQWVVAPLLAACTGAGLAHLHGRMAWMASMPPLVVMIAGGSLAAAFFIGTMKCLVPATEYSGIFSKRTGATPVK